MTKLLRRWVSTMEHPPRRPDWTCLRCGREWPCEQRRARRWREYAGSTVAMTLDMSGYLGQAYTDLPHVDRGALYQRFLGWVRRP